MTIELTDIANLYVNNDQAYTSSLWNRFPMTSPDFRYLNSDSVKRSVHGYRNGIINSLRNSFFPDQSVEQANESFREALYRGCESMNRFIDDYLGPDVLEHFNFPSISYPLDLQQAVSESYRLMEKGISKGDAELLLKAYTILRSIEIGYRVVMIDDSFPVLYSEDCFNQIRERLDDFFGISAVSSDSERFSSMWNTRAGVQIYSTDENPFHSRIKALGSMLLKIYNQLQFPDSITDCVGVELIVKDDDSRTKMLEYLRDETRFMLVFEKLKSSRKKKVDSASSEAFDVVKFVWRMPVLSESRDSNGHVRSYPRVPVEFQIYTHDGIESRETTASHDEYKKKQLMKVFPGLFPKQIYVPYLESKGVFNGC